MSLWVRNKHTFTALNTLTKTIEARVWKGFITTLSVGDIIDIMFQNTMNMKVVITKISYYDNFDRMCDVEDVTKIMPPEYYDHSSIMKLMSYYSSEMVNKYGVVAIHIDKISCNS